MHVIRHYQHWSSGSSPHLRVADVIPKTRSICQWTDTFPWAEMIEAFAGHRSRRQ